MKVLISKSLLSLSLAALASSVLLSGCANMSDGQKSAATGAVLGALAGAAIGDSKGSAAAGAAIGALGGYVWNHEMEKKKRAGKEKANNNPRKTADQMHWHLVQKKPVAD